MAFALSMWLWGGMLYIWMMSLIFYRYTFFRLSPGDLSPPYWINMGAMAISTLAGSLLIINAPDAPFLLSLLPFIKGFTVFYWATGTWWIPMLVVLALWRHVYRRFPMKYDPLYWGAVFPLGMYAASTEEMITAMGFDFLGLLRVNYYLYIALAAWMAAFAEVCSVRRAAPRRRRLSILGARARFAPGSVRRYFQPCATIFRRMKAICVASGRSFGQTSWQASSDMQPNTPLSSPMTS